MQYSLLKQAITLISLTLIGLISLLGAPEALSVPEAHHPVVEVSQFRVFPNLYSISITHNQNQEDFYKISPYDDVIFYEDGTWDKVIRGNEQIQNETLVNPSLWQKKVIWPLQALFKKPQVRFTSSSKGISYGAYKDDNKIIIKKKITKLPQKATGFTNSFVFSKDDEIFDSDGKQYLLSEFKEDRTEIPGVSGLFFRNPKNTAQIFLPIDSNQKVIIDRIYRLVEVKVEFPNAVEEVEVEQEIIFPYTL